MKVKEPEPEFEHGWANPLPWFPEDMYLRGHGFEIRYRFRRGPVLWLRNGKLSTHAQAMAEVRAALAKAVGKVQVALRKAR